jgi:Leucine-rich repeat (LRR) protein
MILSSCSGLVGEIEFISAMTNIFELWFDENEGLVGTIPTEIGTLTELASLSFSNCDLSGVIPTEIGKLTKMEQMWLFGNWFSGDIPTEIGLLAQLEILGLEDNDISGVSMPDEVCDLDLVALSADCGGDSYFMNCTCCTCCEPPCPIVNLPLYETRFLR